MKVLLTKVVGAGRGGLIEGRTLFAELEPKALIATVFGDFLILITGRDNFPYIRGIWPYSSPFFFFPYLLDLKRKIRIRKNREKCGVPGVLELIVKSKPNRRKLVAISRAKRVVRQRVCTVGGKLRNPFTPGVTPRGGVG